MSRPQPQGNPSECLQSHGEHWSMKSRPPDTTTLGGIRALSHKLISLCLPCRHQGWHLFIQFPFQPFPPLWSSDSLLEHKQKGISRASEQPSWKNCLTTGIIGHSIFWSLKLLGPQTLFCFALSLQADKERGSAKAPGLFPAGGIKTH